MTVTLRKGCVLQGVTSESFVYECAPHVLFKGHGEVGMGDDSCGGGGEHAAETNTEVGS